MSKLTEQLALIVGEQSAEGSINTSVRDATSITASNGVLFEKDSLDLEFERKQSDPQPVTGSFTLQPGEFIDRHVSAFSFDFKLKGSGTTLSSSDGDHDLPAPIVDIFEGAGLLDSSSNSSATNYALGTPKFLTFKAWRGATSYTLQDCRTALKFKLVPSEPTIVTVTVFAGAITQNSSDTFPTSIAYGKQASTIAPILRNAGASLGGVSRGILEGEVELNPEFESFPDSNATLGFSFEQTGRKVTFKGKMYVDSSSPVQDWTNLGLTSSFPDLAFRLGAASADPSNSLLFTLQDMNFSKFSIAHEANRIVFEMDGNATNATSNAEFTLASS